MIIQNSKILHFTLSFCILIFVFCIFSKVEAAVLYLDPSEGKYSQGDVFITSVRINPEGECINAVEAGLTFPKDILEVIDFSKGDSILAFWIKNETRSSLVSFAGGIPAGYCGRLSGDPGESNLLGKIIFQVRETGGNPNQAQIKFLDSSQVLLNDGLGTPVKLTTNIATFDIKPPGSIQGRDEWQEELAKDTIPPEPFSIEISRDASIFDGKYFITFFTSDKQTGINYYEVKEGERNWRKAESPYLLEDQKLGSIIKVGVVDKAGNERIIELKPAPRPKVIPYWIIILILAGIGISYWFYKKLKIKK